MEMTFTISDELVPRLQSHQEQLPQILLLGLHENVKRLGNG